MVAGSVRMIICAGRLVFLLSRRLVRDGDSVTEGRFGWIGARSGWLWVASTEAER